MRLRARVIPHAGCMTIRRKAEKSRNLKIVSEGSLISGRYEVANCSLDPGKAEGTISNSDSLVAFVTF